MVAIPDEWRLACKRALGEGKKEKDMANILAVPGPNSRFKLSGAHPAGFWAGLWHGVIAPVTFIVSLFNDNVRIYETNNRGRLYDFGFIIGISAACGGSGSSANAAPSM